jgi:serine/arginine repetitive matrix protein 1
MQINLTGFLEDKTPQFMLELWNLLLEAQKEPSGIPKQLIEEKLKEKELKMEMFEKAKA